MTWLLDTHALLWALFHPQRLGSRCRGILETPGHTVLVSPLSYWEISLKYSLGKLELPATRPEEIPGAAQELELEESPLSAGILASYHRLPRHPEHRDPFDRLLIWQAICGGHVLLGKDKRLGFYRPHGLLFDW